LVPYQQVAEHVEQALSFTGLHEPEVDERVIEDVLSSTLVAEEHVRLLMLIAEWPAWRERLVTKAKMRSA
jgi:hypothetical protein